MLTSAKRLATNKNLTVLSEPAYMGYKLHLQHGELIQEYVSILYKGLIQYTHANPRTLAIRLELLYPSDFKGPVTNQQITQFFKGLKYRLNLAYEKRIKAGHKAHLPKLAYMWFRERDTSLYPHFHLLLLLNRDAYSSLGDYANPNHLLGKIRAAWAGALGIDWEHAKGLATASACKGGSPYHHLTHNDPFFDQQMNKLFERTSYLCKAKTKHYGQGERNMGYSGFNV